VAAGGTTFDTSNLYQAGQAENVLGGLLAGARDDFLVIMKYSGPCRNIPAESTPTAEVTDPHLADSTH
jgi:aryl-alcohol dehydrogenase-like predicted oxidoreductase